MALRAAEKNLEIALDISEISIEWVNGDPGRIRQILNNLLANAIKFTEQGSVSIRASLTSKEGQRVFNCSVIDTGIGISNKQMAHLFTPFTQADSSTTRKYGGTGLGLSIVKQLCELLNGKVWVESKQGHGSSFHVKLNLANAKQTEPEPEINTSQQAIHLNTNAHLLLVEDNTINQLVAKELLKQLGFNVTVAADGVEAIQVLNNAKQPFDLIFMDCQMPKMDGYEATKRIRKGEAGSQHENITIIALTANAMKGDKEKCIDIGMDDYLKKPFIKEDLEQILSHYLAVKNRTNT